MNSGHKTPLGHEVIISEFTFCRTHHEAWESQNFFFLRQDFFPLNFLSHWSRVDWTFICMSGSPIDVTGSPRLGLSFLRPHVPVPIQILSDFSRSPTVKASFRAAYSLRIPDFALYLCSEVFLFFACLEIYFKIFSKKNCSIFPALQQWVHLCYLVCHNNIIIRTLS